MADQARKPNSRHKVCTAQADHQHNGEAALAKIICRSSQMQEVKALIRRVAEFPGVPVLITGETGTGKELVADALHACSPRAGGPLIKVNCAAIPENLFESQLFGHCKGAFSGAHQHHVGLVEHAKDGVLFLDEIGSLKQENQVKLLRFLENSSYLPLGEKKERTSNAWITAATNQPLHDLTNKGLLREDLCHRLRTLEITLVPLHERKEDILSLARHFLKLYAEKYGHEPKELDHEVQHILLDYHWPGNVRELKNVLRKLSIAIPSRCLRRCHLLSEIRSDTGKPANGKTKTLEEVERIHILDTLKSTQYQIRKTAQVLGISRNTLKKKLVDYGVYATF